MKKGMLIAFLITLVSNVFFYMRYEEIELPFYALILMASTIVFGIIYLSILISKDESDDFDGDGN
jgi:hypothetical protein